MVNGLDGMAAQDLQGTGDDTRKHDLTDNPAGIIQPVKGGEGCAGYGRSGVDFEYDLRNHPKGPFRAHKESGQIITGHTLHCFRSGSHDPSIR